MSRHRVNFIERVPGPSHTNDDAYRRDRYEMYGTDATIFPTQRARNAYPALVECKARGDRIRGDYQHEAYRCRDYVARQDNMQREYYEQTSASKEKDPASSARDLYGRSVPRGARPSDRGYPASIPEPGQYATNFQSVQTEPEYIIREPKKNKKNKR
ncbi:MAG: hypothetical protein Q9185_006166 [Variospora sp. 1 TL-2023]